MNPRIIKQLSYFKHIKVPLFNRNLIQACALNHLGLSDMGKLRDRMEGQNYYDKLEEDILAELAFESIVSEAKFDWNKRNVKTYIRKEYTLEGKKIRLITFSDESLPKLNINPNENYIFIFRYNEYKVLLSGLASYSDIKANSTHLRKELYQVENFSEFRMFNNKEELLPLLAC